VICLERFALNVDDEELPDNSGRVLNGTPIVRGGPAAYESTLPLNRLLKVLRAKGIRANISNHAGTYVCNHAFYVARHESERLRPGMPCGFIHVPNLRRGSSKTQAMALDDMAEAVEVCLHTVAKISRSVDRLRRQ
jgi:pyroglutamyl-peptidase